MPNTFTLIQAVTVGSGGPASIDFSSIPSTYTDLCLRISARTSYSGIADDLYLKFNNSTAANYSFRTLLANGSTVRSQAASGQTLLYCAGINGATSTSNTFSNVDIYIPNYAGSTNKSVSVDNAIENNATTADLGFLANLWSQTAAINQITILGGYAALVQYSTAYLYGIIKS
jgi:hypothetical protein